MTENNERKEGLSRLIDAAVKRKLDFEISYGILVFVCMPLVWFGKWVDDNPGLVVTWMGVVAIGVGLILFAVRLGALVWERARR
jgi:hypothetical protein